MIAATLDALSMWVRVNIRRLLPFTVHAINYKEAPCYTRTLFTNVNIFGGKNDKLIQNGNVLVEGNLIKQVATKPISAGGATVIDGAGRTLTPGLIDAHVHIASKLAPAPAFYAPPDYLATLALVEAKNTLMRGYTSIRDTGGQAQGVKMAIDERRFDGPPIWYSGAPADWSEDQKAKQQQAKNGLDNLFALAKKYKIKIALGTDLVADMEIKKQQAYELTNRLKWFSPAEILTQATANNAELLSWSGPRNPCPGKLGVIEEGALAGLLLVDGNPLENLELFNEPEKNLVVIMKEGKIYKNSI